MVLELPVRHSESPTFCGKYDLFRTQFELLFLPVFVCGGLGQFPGFSDQDLSSGLSMFSLYQLSDCCRTRIFSLSFSWYWNEKETDPAFLFLEQSHCLNGLTCSDLWSGRILGSQKDSGRKRGANHFFFSIYILLYVHVYSVYPCVLFPVPCILSTRFYRFLSACGFTYTCRFRHQAWCAGI